MLEREGSPNLSFTNEESTSDVDLNEDGRKEASLVDRSKDQNHARLPRDCENNLAVTKAGTGPAGQKSGRAEC